MFLIILDLVQFNIKLESLFSALFIFSHFIFNKSTHKIDQNYILNGKLITRNNFLTHF